MTYHTPFDAGMRSGAEAVFASADGGDVSEGVGGIFKGDLGGVMNTAADANGLPKAKNEGKPEVALILGTDVISHIRAHKLLGQLSEAGVRAKVYLAAHKTPEKDAIELFPNREYTFFERELNQVAYEFLGRNKLQNNRSLNTPKQMGTVFGIDVEEVEDVNDPAFIQHMREQGYPVIVSDRCYQRFSQDFIDMANEDGVFWNLHPGRLRANHKDGEYRGIMTGLRKMLDGRRYANWSLHEVEWLFDAGAIVDMTMDEIDYNKPMFNIMLDSINSSVALLRTKITEQLEHGGVRVKPQKEPEMLGPLYSVPTEDELTTFFGKGYKMVDPRSVIKMFVARYIDLASKDNHPIGMNLAQTLVDHTNEWYLRNGSQFRVELADILPKELLYMLPANDDGANYEQDGGAMGTGPTG